MRSIKKSKIISVIKASLLLSVVSFISVCHTEETKNDTETKAHQVEDKDESSKVRKKFSGDTTIKISLSSNLFDIAEVECIFYGHFI